MLDGAHDQLDFPFVINDHQFDHLYYLVDGIYPAISRFLLTINNPTTTLDSLFAPKQEGWRKAVERAFGVWKKKFLSLVTKLVCTNVETFFILLLQL
jgi:hypothetical protein